MMCASIGIIGDFHPDFVTHVMMEPAAKEAAERIGVDVDVQWIAAFVEAAATSAKIKASLA
jgi:hypothetical protein